MVQLKNKTKGSRLNSVEESFDKLKNDIANDVSPDRFDANIQTNIISDVIDYHRDEDNNTLLMYAIKCGSKKWCEAIIHNSHFDIDKFFPKKVDKWLTCTNDAHLKEVVLSAALCRAVKKGNYKDDNIRHYIDKGANVNVVDKETGMTPLLYAIKQHNEKLGQLLIKNGADLNEQGNNTVIPLIYALTNMNEEIAKILIDQEANVNVKDKKGKTPLMYVAEQADSDLYQLLIDRGADSSAADDVNDQVINYIDSHRKDKHANIVKNSYYSEANLDDLYEQTQKYIENIQILKSGDVKDVEDKMFNHDFTKYQNVVQEIIDNEFQFDVIDLWQKVIDNKKNDKIFHSLVANSKNMTRGISDEKILKFYDHNKDNKDIHALGNALLGQAFLEYRVELSEKLMMRGAQINNKVISNISKQQKDLSVLPVLFLIKIKEHDTYKDKAVDYITNKMYYHDDYKGNDLFTLFEDDNSKIFSPEEQQILYKRALDKKCVNLAQTMHDEWGINANTKSYKGQTLFDIKEKRNVELSNKNSKKKPSLLSRIVSRVVSLFKRKQNRSKVNKSISASTQHIVDNSRVAVARSKGKAQSESVTNNVSISSNLTPIKNSRTASAKPPSL